MMSHPFKVGYHLDTAKGSRIKDQDGYISAIQYFLFAVAVGVGVSYAHSVTVQNQTVQVTKIAVEVVMNIYMLIGIAFMLAFWCRRDLAKLHADISKHPGGTRARTLQQRLEHLLPVLGIIIFYIFGSLLDVFKVVSHARCLSQFFLCGAFVLWSYIMSIAFHVIRLIFMGLLMVFCYVFHTRAMLRCAYVRYGFMAIVVPSVVLWFDATLYDSIKDTDHLVNMRECQVLHSKNISRIVSDDFFPCITQMTRLYNSTNAAFPFLYPLNIEFLLLAIETVLHIFLTTKTSDELRNLKNRSPPFRSVDTQTIIDWPPLSSGTGGEQEEDEDIYSSIDSEPPGPVTCNVQSQTNKQVSRLRNCLICMCCTCGSCTGEERVAESEDEEEEFYSSVGSEPPDLINADRRDVLSDTTRNIQIQTDNEVSCSRSCLICLSCGCDCFTRRERGLEQDREPLLQDSSGDSDLVSREAPTCSFAFLVINIVLVALGILTFDESNKDSWLIIFRIMKIFYWLPGIVLCLVAFESSERFESKFSGGYYGFEMMVIVSAFGYMVQSVLTIGSIVGYVAGSELIPPGEAHKKDGILPWVMLPDQLLNLTEMILQTSFMAHAANVTPGVARTDCEKRARRTFRNALIYMIMSNFVMWILDSFVEMKNSYLEPVQLFYYGHGRWHLITHLLIPITLFYRFNSCIIFTKIFLHQK